MSALPIPDTSSRPAPLLRKAAAFGVGVLLFGLGLAGPMLHGSPFLLTLMGNAAVLGILALAVAFLMHHSGLVVFGVATFSGTAGFLFGIAAMYLQWSAMGSLLFALAGSLLCAGVIGALIVRMPPLAFMMLTLSFNEMANRIVTLDSLREITGGHDGLLVSFSGTIFGLTQADFANPRSFWAIVFTLSTALAIALWRLDRTYFCQVLRGIRQNEERMRFSGFDTFGPRWLAFMVMALLAALAGLLNVLNSGFVSAESISLVRSGDALVSALLGGITTVVGPFAGALFHTLAQDQLSSTKYLELVTGVLMIVIIVAMPQGLVGVAIQAARKLQAPKG